MTIHPDLSFVELSNRDFAEGIEAPVQRPLFEYWTALRGAAQVPLRQSFRPERLSRQLIPHIGLVKVDRGGQGIAFEYRIIGEAIFRTFGTGARRRHPTDDRSPAYGRKLEGLYALAAETHAATRWAAPNLLIGGAESLTHRLCLPLADSPRGPVTALLFSTISEIAPDGRPEEDFQGHLIVDIGSRNPVFVCARRHPAEASA